MAGADENQHGHQSNQRVEAAVQQQPGRQIAARSPAAQGLDGDRRGMAHEERRGDSQEKDQPVAAGLPPAAAPISKGSIHQIQAPCSVGMKKSPSPQTAVEQFERRTGCVGRHRIGTEREFPGRGITSTM